MAETGQSFTPFNSPLETGVRALIVLAAAYPEYLDLQRLLEFDYLLVHSGDVGGPPSLHPPLPLRAGELLIRRGLIERGLLLMISRGLIQRFATASGFTYQARDSAGPFLDALTTAYIDGLKERADWLLATFGQSSPNDLRQVLNSVYDQWTTEFQPHEMPGGGQR
jgi:hypothetical protein